MPSNDDSRKRLQTNRIKKILDNIKKQFESCKLGCKYRMVRSENIPRVQSIPFTFSSLYVLVLIFMTLGDCYSDHLPRARSHSQSSGLLGWPAVKRPICFTEAWLMITYLGQGATPRVADCYDGLL